MYETFDYSLDGAIGLVRLNRPDKLNAINPKMVRELRDLVAAVEADDAARVLVFTGNGRAFSAGADISEIVALGTAPAFAAFIETIQKTYNALEDLGRPTIAAMNGVAFGGGLELALACDFRILAEDGKVGVPEILIGALPGAGGTQRLAHMLPQAVAKQMIYMGESLDAARALALGLVNQVVPKDRVLEAAMTMAARLAELPPIAIRAAKLLVHGAVNDNLKTGIEAERQAMAYLYGTEDRNEGMRAFLEKRKAKFVGR